LVVTVGLDKPYILAKAIMGARERSVDPHRHSATKSSIPLSVRRKVLLGIDLAGPTLMKHYACEIAALGVGAALGIPALSEFCLVASLILCFDALYLFTVSVAVLTLKMELNRIRASDPDHPHTAREGADVEGELKEPLATSGVSKAKMLLVCSF
jgi:hydroxymethylglutaryl-CoA reductase (NADPH)